MSGNGPKLWEQFNNLYLTFTNLPASCGEEVIQWRDFADAVALFATRQNQINSLLKRRFTKSPHSIGDMRALGANTLVEATSNLFRRSTDGRILERLLNMETLLSTLLAFEATDPRDIVYAVLSIANDTPYSDSDSAAQITASITDLRKLGDHRIIPNYDKSLVEVCTDFVEYCVAKSDSLDILVRHWAPAPKRQPLDPDSPPQKMPTWVSLITGSAFGDPEAALQGRSNGDSFVGISSRQHQKNYNACASLRPWAIFDRHDYGNAGETPSPQERGHLQSHQHRATNLTPPTTPNSRPCNGSLFVKGIYLDTIGQLSPRAAQGMIFQECLEMGGWIEEDGLENVPDLLWRTFVADRGPDGKSAPSWYRRACLECLTHINQNGDLNTGALMENHNTPTTMVAFLKRVQRVVWNRKFFRSRGGSYQDESDQLFGLAPTKSKIGDWIVLLFGCSVPVILREFKTADDRYFELVGEAYVHGMMDGEAFSREKPAYPYDDFDATQTFKIR